MIEDDTIFSEQQVKKNIERILTHINRWYDKQLLKCAFENILKIIKK